MSDPTHSLLLSALSQSTWQMFSPFLTRVSISLQQPFETANEPIEFVYFIERGLASMVASMPNGHRNEVGLFGSEGMTGSAVIQGDTQSPFDCFGQMEGTALRISASDLLQLVTEMPELNQLMRNFARSLSIQTAYTALANGQAHVDQRLARWLLMVHDRVVGDTFNITHEYLSIMLGVRRTGVTEAIHVLEGKHLITSTRNKLVIRDREGLIVYAGGSYGPSEREYRRVTGLRLGTGDVAYREGASAGLPN